MLRGVSLVVQTTFRDSPVLDAFSFCQYRLTAAEINISWLDSNAIRCGERIERLFDELPAGPFEALVRPATVGILYKWFPITKYE